MSQQKKMTDYFRVYQPPTTLTQFENREKSQSESSQSQNDDARFFAKFQGEFVGKGSRGMEDEGEEEEERGRKRKFEGISKERRNYDSSSSSSSSEEEEEEEEFYRKKKKKKKKKKKRKKKRVVEDSSEASSSEEEKIPHPKKKKKRNLEKETSLLSLDPKEMDDFRTSYYKSRQRISTPYSGDFEKGDGLDYSFRDPEKIRDGSSHRRKKGHEDYDPTSLYIPPAVYSEMKGVNKQFWDIKKNNFDKTVFFKKGKFYELYDLDAIEGERLFGLVRSGVKGQGLIQVGIPEARFPYWVKKWLRRGKKVAIVEEVRDAKGESVRDLRYGGKNGLQMRRVREIHTPGTITDASLAPRDYTGLFMSFYERKTMSDESKEENVVFGVCMIDCFEGRIVVGQFEDGKRRRNFKTILRSFLPAEIVYCGISKETERALKEVKTVSLDRKKLIKLKQKDFEWNSPNKGLASPIVSKYPDIFDRERERKLCDFLEDLKNETNAANTAFQGALSYLKTLQKDKKILRYKNFIKLDAFSIKTNMVVDGQTLKNLEILKNQRGGDDCTVLSFLDHCVTRFGKKKMIQLCRTPLMQVPDILKRHEALKELEEIFSDENLMQKFDKQLKLIVDIPSSIFNLNSIGSNEQGFATHDNTKRVRMLKIFVDCYTSIRELEVVIRKWFENSKSALLKFETREIKQLLSDFKPKFELFEVIIQKQKKEKNRKAKTDDFELKEKHLRGDEVHMDRLIEINETKKGIIKEIDELVEKYRKHARSDLVEVEIVQRTARNVDIVLKYPKKLKLKCLSGDSFRSYTLDKKKKKSYKKTKTKLLEKISDKYNKNLNQRNKFLDTVISEYFLSFSTRWMERNCHAFIEDFSVVECLLSFVKINSRSPDDFCIPKVLDFDDKSIGQPILSIEGMFHPVIKEKMEKEGKGKSFVKNDIHLGRNEKRFVVLSGSNMSGKSTLLKGVCITLLLAQIGCYVPASSMEFTTVDRICTRIGANDSIFKGESTFQIEMKETSTIIAESTVRTFVVLDELGRGTGTNGAYSIAMTVLGWIAEGKRALTIFASHMHELIKVLEKELYVFVSFKQMNIFFDDNKLSFLFKLGDGSAEKSYALNVAEMAGINQIILSYAKDFESHLKETVSDQGEEFNKKERQKNKVYTLAKILILLERLGQKALQIKESTLERLRERVQKIIHKAVGIFRNHQEEIFP